MLNKKLTDWEALEHIELIKDTANQVWGNQVKFGELKVLNSPYPEFEWPLKLYNGVDVRLEYERSTVGLMVNTPLGFIGLSQLAERPVYKGLKSCKPENLLHNFQVLDEVAKNIIQQL